MKTSHLIHLTLIAQALVPAAQKAAAEAPDIEAYDAPARLARALKEADDAAMDILRATPAGRDDFEVPLASQVKLRRMTFGGRQLRLGEGLYQIAQAIRLLETDKAEDEKTFTTQQIEIHNPYILVAPTPTAAEHLRLLRLQTLMEHHPVYPGQCRAKDITSNGNPVPAVTPDQP